MSTQKRKFELFARLQALGFTYEEAVSLRRIEMTLQRWGERECGDEHGRCIERDEETGKPYMTYDKGRGGERGRYPIADRETGALRRLNNVIRVRNLRESSNQGANDYVFSYHQPDCRGCNLYLCTREQLTEKYGPDAGKLLPIDSHYTRGLAVCC